MAYDTVDRECAYCQTSGPNGTSTVNILGQPLNLNLGSIGFHATSCNSCLTGTFRTSLTHCALCPDGTYAGTRGNSSCLKCGHRTYSNGLGFGNPFGPEDGLPDGYSHTEESMGKGYFYPGTGSCGSGPCGGRIALYPDKLDPRYFAEHPSNKSNGNWHCVTPETVEPNPDPNGTVPPPGTRSRNLPSGSCRDSSIKVPFGNKANCIPVEAGHTVIVRRGIAPDEKPEDFYNVGQSKYPCKWYVTHPTNKGDKIRHTGECQERTEGYTIDDDRNDVSQCPNGQYADVQKYDHTEGNYADPDQYTGPEGKMWTYLNPNTCRNCTGYTYSNKDNGVYVYDNKNGGNGGIGDVCTPLPDGSIATGCSTANKGEACTGIQQCYITGGNNFVDPIDKMKCEGRTPGYYINTNGVGQTQCARGTFAKSPFYEQTACELCPGWTYSIQNAKDAQDNDVNVRDTNCHPNKTPGMQVNKLGNVGSDDLSACPSTQYSNASTAVLLKPLDKFLGMHQQGSIRCVQCDAGNRIGDSENGGYTSCTPCGYKKYSFNTSDPNGAGATVCQDPSPGYRLSDCTGHGAETRCKGQYNCYTDGQPEGIGYEGASYVNFGAANSVNQNGVCIKRTPGHIINSGKDGETKCNPGEYSDPTSGHMECVKCKAGTYAANPGDKEGDCVACYENSISGIGAASCTPCPDNKITVGADRTTCKTPMCPAGSAWYNAAPSNDNCSAGFFKHDVQSPTEPSCPAGFYRVTIDEGING